MKVYTLIAVSEPPSSTKLSSTKTSSSVKHSSSSSKHTISPKVTTSPVKHSSSPSMKAPTKSLSSSKHLTSSSKHITTTSRILSNVPVQAGNEPTLSNDPQIGPFIYAGCASSPSGFKSLTEIQTSGEMTASLCLGSCSAYAYAGIFSLDCFCGNSMGSSTWTQVGCNMPCPGNQDQACGGRLGSQSPPRSDVNAVGNVMEKRQLNLSNILLTIYHNTDFNADLSTPLLTVYSTHFETFNTDPTAASSTFTSVYATLLLGDGPVNDLASRAWPALTDSMVQDGQTTDNIGSPTISVIPASKVFGMGMGRPTNSSQYYTTIISSTPSPLPLSQTRAVLNLSQQRTSTNVQTDHSQRIQ